MTAPYLTYEQRKLLALVANGDTQEGIAAALGCTRPAINHRLTVIREQLQARNITHAVALAYQHGLLGYQRDESAIDPTPEDTDFGFRCGSRWPAEEPR